MQRLTKRNIKVINHDTGQQIDFPTFGKEAGEDAYNQVSNQLTSLQAQLESSIASMSEAIVTDKTLTIEDAPADAKAAGDAINNLRGAVGSPLVAATAASMADTNKVYVYTGSETGYTNGNWYYHDGTSWVSGGVYNSVAVDLDSTLTLANKAPDSKVVGDAISSLNEDITNLIKTPEETDADLYIADDEGNVIAKFADGHFAVKEFNTATYTDKLARVAPSSESSDLDVVDGNGNVLVRFEDGEIQTGSFDSASVKENIATNTDNITDIRSWSLSNRLANPIFTSRELYNEENPNAQIDAVEALVYGHTGTTNAGYRIPTVCVTNAGTILVAGTHMENAIGDYGDFSIDYNRKEAGGSWGAVTNIVPFDDTREDYGGVLNNEFLVDRNTGTIYLFYGTEKQDVVWWEVTTEDGDFKYITSSDDGETWSSPVSLKNLWDTDTYDYCIPSCTKGITLTDGTLIVPCFCKKGNVASTAHSYPLLLIKPSGGDWYFSSVASVTGIDHLDECAVVEGSTENEIWLYCRPNTNYGTGVNRGYNKFVYDISGDTFTHQDTGCFDTNRHNCFGIDRITIDSTLIYLMTFTDTNANIREKITLWASLDGDTWIRVYRIHTAKSAGYSVIDNYNGTIAVAYESASNRGVIAVQDISALSTLIYDSASDYIVRNISVQDRMQMLFNALRGID